MKTKIMLTAALIAAFAVPPRAAQADGVFGFLFHGDPRVVVSGLVVGAATTGTYLAIKPRHHVHTRFGMTKLGAYGLTTVGCMAVSPIVAAAWVGATENRELTQHEALGLAGNCVVPVLGGMFWDAAYAAHPEWENGPVRARY